MPPPGTSITSAGCLCVFLALVSADKPSKLYRKVGDEVLLKPDTTSVTGVITNIIWKDGPNIAIQWDQGTEPDLYRHFRERGSLNVSNGAMTIKGLMRDDSQVYTPEINNEIKAAVELVVISPVPKPTLSVSCDEEMTRCTLTCDGDTADAEPVTYKWKSGDRVAASTKEHHITKGDSTSFTELTCELENPVSHESSHPKPNPFAPPTPPTPIPKPNISTGVTVFIALLIAVLLLASIHRCKAGMWFYQKASMPWTADFWRKHERQVKDASTRETEDGHTDDEQPMNDRKQDEKSI